MDKNNVEKIIKEINKNDIDNTLKNDYYTDILKSIKEIKNRYKKQISKKAKVEELYNNSEQFIPHGQVLPSWVVNNIDDFKLISQNTIMDSKGQKYQLNNTLNDLNGAEWTFFINSVLNTRFKTSGEDSYGYNLRKIHPSPKPPNLMRDIIKFFTKENEIVLDYFMGVGGTLLGASECNRRAVGIDLNKEYINTYKKVAENLNFKIFPTIEGDSLKVLKDTKKMKKILNNEQIGLILIDPPYSNMMSREKTGADMKKYGNSATPFTKEKCDLGNMENEEFLENLKQSVISATKYLKNKGYIVVFIKDLQPKKKECNLLHSQIINKLNEIDNIYYKGLKIWADQTAKLFPYGYPFSFVANQIHQYIMIFRKE